jgi:hypothetical protein
VETFDCQCNVASCGINCGRIIDDNNNNNIGNSSNSQRQRQLCVCTYSYMTLVTSKHMTKLG